MSAIRLWVLLLCIAGSAGLALAQGAGISPDGQKGQLHVVVKGDTLWDISAKYLETPWIWPSIWKENDDIQNPHLIYPGDLIWITEGLMRKVTREEANELLRAQEMEPAAPEPELPAAPDPQDLEPDPFASLDAGIHDIERVLNYPGLHRFSFITPDQLAGSGAIVGSHEEHYWASQNQRTIVSLGEGQVHVGEPFTVYRVRRRVLHPDTGVVLGYFTQILGRAEIVEIHPESSFAKVMSAYAEIEPGDRITPYQELPTEIVENNSEDRIDGVIVAQQPYRLYAGWNDFVLLDRGSVHGVQAGNRFTVFRGGREVRDPLTRAKVLVPDDVIGRMFVVSVQPSTSLALVTRAARKIREGDQFRN